MRKLFFRHALLATGWAPDVAMDIDAEGRIAAIASGCPPPDRQWSAAMALPGLPNLHSHGFQRGAAACAETAHGDGDDFWTWRETMFRFVERLNPEQLAAITAQAYIEMLEAGFTAVAEFHYLHHDGDGQPFADIAEMAGAIAAAADITGIGLTLLPVLYSRGDFGGEPATGAQRRFFNTTDRYALLLEKSHQAIRTLPDATLGVAPHSLRAVTAEQLVAATNLAGDGPIHIHVAEQHREVRDCLAWSGARPVQWLLDNLPVDERWCLLHATHMTTAETVAAAGSGAVIGLCPLTESNLGDGIFDGVTFLAAGGQYGIGSDSNIRISVAEELRQLEYGQRLRDQRRCRMLSAGGSNGRAMFDAAVAGGARACGRSLGALATGYRADIIALDTSHPLLAGRTEDGWLDGWIFSAGNELVDAVWVGGRQVVNEGRHIEHSAITQRFTRTMQELM